MKTCFKCLRELDISSFYAHPRMADGHLNKCKDCTRDDARKNYASDRAKRAEYEREREKTAHRRAQKLAYQAEHRKRHPQKYKARMAVSRALARGVITREPCKSCGARKTQAHHHDYSKPLDVQWLCHACHMAEHGKKAIQH